MKRVLAIGECMAELAPAGQPRGFTLGFAGDTFNTAWYLARIAPDIDVSYPVHEVSERLGVSTNSLYKWMKVYAKAASQASSVDHEAENRRLKRELVRMTEERDILKKGVAVVRHWSEDNGRARTSRRMQDEVRVCGLASSSVFGTQDVSLPQHSS